MRPKKTFDDYLKMSENKKKKFQSHLKCECGQFLVRDGHSTGDLHVVCPVCKVCPDCEEGNV